MRGKDARGAQRREQEWLAREATQRCAICGRKFVMRAERRLGIICPLLHNSGRQKPQPTQRHQQNQRHCYYSDKDAEN